MSDEENNLTKTVTVKRSGKKKSSYVVGEQDGYYYVAECPNKARVRPGDRILGINGISSDEFMDEDDANDLIDSIRITVVPQDKLDEYDELNGGAEAADEEDSGEFDREESRKVNSIVPVPAPSFGGGRDDGPKVYHCNNCDHDNEDLSEDEDGDLVCEECGHVIEPQAPEAGNGAGTVHICHQCGEENHDLQPDEDGDLVCQECGHVIPEEQGEEEQDGEPRREIPYECPDCEHITINPEPDEEGDRICEECGCILPEKYHCNCENCGYENIDPEPDEDGAYLCENCGEELEVEEAEMTGADKLNAMRDEVQGEAAEGQEFDEKGKPLTNPEGKKLTPADMFNPGDVITVTVGKSDPRQDSGLKIEERNGKYYVRKVPSGGLFAKTPVIAGDKILELNGKDHHEYKNLNELKKVLKDEERITVVVLRKDPEASESSASSVNYDELNPITPDGDIEDEDDTSGRDNEARDDDTIGYDGDNCGCAWCPDCN
ncbi:TFIIB zinc-binding protein [Nitzschia inconspicua]|uniref:TFIIB zinc-binding protein n=1 Tax=Nitzschia inconspicua TaxID=303405 RepID=A0A9K3LGA5_9STRA|nr:TFIIB zinc-binding protein [Nitzschia inconspicua]